MGIIPIRAGLTMMGIGNLTIGNTFRIKSGVLLPKYQNWGHVITGIEHHISKARWETTLKTQYYPVYDKADVVTPTTMAKLSQTGVEANIASGTSTSYKVAPRNPLQTQELPAGTFEQTGAHSSRGNSSRGDQTGTEVSSNNRKVGSIADNWTKVYRCNDPAVAARAAEVARKLAASNQVGYSQADRDSTYAQLIGQYGGDVDKFIAAGGVANTDCSAFCNTCYAAADPTYNRTCLGTTRNMDEVYSSDRGWTVYDAKSITSKDQLQPGDILWRNGHVEMVTRV